MHILDILLCIHVQVFLQDDYPKMSWWKGMHIWKYDRLCQVALQQWYSNLYTCQQHITSFLKSISRIMFFLCPPVFPHLIGDEQYPITAFISIFLITCKHEHLLMAFWHFFFCELFSHILCSFFYWIVCLFSNWAIRAIYICRILFLYLLVMWQVFSPSLSLVFWLYFVLPHFYDTFMLLLSSKTFRDIFFPQGYFFPNTLIVSFIIFSSLIQLEIFMGHRVQ